MRGLFYISAPWRRCGGSSAPSASPSFQSSATEGCVALQCAVEPLGVTAVLWCCFRGSFVGSDSETMSDPPPQPNSSTSPPFFLIQEEVSDIRTTAAREPGTSSFHPFKIELQTKCVARMENIQSDGGRQRPHMLLVGDPVTPFNRASFT